MAKISIELSDDKFEEISSFCDIRGVKVDDVVNRLLTSSINELCWLTDVRSQFADSINKLSTLADRANNTYSGLDNVFDEWPIDSMTSISQAFGIDVKDDNFLRMSGISSIPILVGYDDEVYSKTVNPFTGEETGISYSDEPFSQFNLGEMQTIYETLMRSYGEEGTEIVQSRFDVILWPLEREERAMLAETTIYLPRLGGARVFSMELMDNAPEANHLILDASETEVMSQQYVDGLIRYFWSTDKYRTMKFVNLSDRQRQSVQEHVERYDITEKVSY